MASDSVPEITPHDPPEVAGWRLTIIGTTLVASTPDDRNRLAVAPDGTISLVWGHDVILPRELLDVLLARGRDFARFGPNHIDPPGCGCTDCIVGQVSRPAEDDAEYEAAKASGRAR